MKMKRILAAFACNLLLLASAGCAGAVENVGDAVGKAVGGVVQGTVGTTYSTQWFDFTVLSAKTVTEYADYGAADGYLLVDVVVSQTSTFDDPIPLGSFDFYVTDGPGENFQTPMDAEDDTMMPDLFYLEKGESAEYHLVFHIPQDADGLVLAYTEVNEVESEGVTYLIDLDVL